MTHRMFVGLVTVVVLMAILGGVPQASLLELVRNGNTAFDREDFKQALEYYEMAEERITDPGLVAMNKAAALYRLGRHREAELAFRCALEGADSKRRMLALFGLGNSLVMQASKADVEVLEEAIACYRLCRRELKPDDDLRRAVEHNLELARLLLTNARTEAKKLAQPSVSKKSANSKRPGDSSSVGKHSRDGDPDASRSNKLEGDPTKADPNRASGTDPMLPGKGRLPVIPDDDALSPFSRADADALLQQAVQRIAEQRRRDWQATSKTDARVKDW